MSESPKDGAGAPERRKRITLERVYQTDVQDVWDLWTTKDGIESWWGPGGFAVTVRKLDLRPGGNLLYAADGVRMTLTFDAMHNDEWTERAVMGWKGELAKADALMAARTIGGRS